MISRAAKPIPSRYIALLRAINVGGHVVKMDVLRAVFESLRFTGVETFIASGNVIFDALPAAVPDLEQAIEARLAKRLGYAVSTFVRTPPDLAAIMTATPFGPADPLASGHAQWVGFVKSPPSPPVVAALLALNSDTDEFQIIGREIYWLRHARVSDSRLTGTRLEKLLGGPSTFRNITTIRKLAAKYTR